MSTWLTKRAATESARAVAVAVATQRGSQRPLARRRGGPPQQRVSKYLRKRPATLVQWPWRLQSRLRLRILWTSPWRTALETSQVENLAGEPLRPLEAWLVLTWAASYGLAWGRNRAWVGAFGGPFAWATVPAGTVIGGLVGSVAGGVAGGFAGSTAASYGANAFFGSIGDETREQFENGFLAMAFPR